MPTTALINSNTLAQRDKLLNWFASIDEKERSLLLLLAVIYNPIGTTKLISVVKTLTEEGFLPGRASHYQFTTDRRASLTEQGILLSKKEGFVLNRLLANALVKQLLNAEPQGLTQFNGLRFIHILRASEQVMPVIQNLQWRRVLSDKTRVLRDLFLLGEMHNFIDLLEPNKNPQLIDVEKNRILVELCFLPYQEEQFSDLPNDIQYLAFASLLRLCLKEGQSIAYPLSLLEDFCQKQSDKQTLRLLLAEFYLYQCRFDEYLAISDTKLQSTYALQLRGIYHVFMAELTEALEAFDLAIKAKNKIARRKRQYIGGIPGFFHQLALIAQNSHDQPKLRQNALDFASYEHDDRSSFEDIRLVSATMQSMLKCLVNGNSYTERLAHIQNLESLNVCFFQLCRLSMLYGHAWCNESVAGDIKALLENAALSAKQALEKIGLSSFVALIKQVQTHFAFSPSDNLSGTSDATKPLSVDIKLNLPAQISAKQSWEYALDRLIALSPAEKQNAPDAKVHSESSKVRIIWELRLGRFEDSIAPREQKSTRTGWTKGRIVSLKRLYENAGSFDYLSPSDQQMCRAIECYTGYGYYAKDQYRLDGERALRAAIGIENLYLEDDLEQAIDLKLQEPELIVSELPEQLCLTLSESLEGLHGSSSNGFAADENAFQPIKNYTVKRLNHTSYQFTPFSQSHLKVMAVLGEEGLLVPMSAKNRALQGIAAIAPFLNIRSDLDAIDTGLDTVEPDLNLYINIEPTNDGLIFTCVQMPFGQKGPICKPGSGSPSMSAQIDGKRISVQRDLIHEQHLLDALDATCPAFLSMADNVLRVDDYQLALDALEQLERAVSENKLAAILRWPKGKKIKISQALTAERMQLAVVKENEWFDITGNIRIDDEQVIELRKLLALVSSSNGRYIELDSQRVLALSHDLKQKLEYLEQVTDEGSFHPLSAPQVEDALQGMRMKTIDAWDKQTALMHESNTLDIPLPKNFEASLRDYQQVGYDWAMRLSHWGAGACLADDMGLGKTLQALAVLLAKAKNGPSLVIAPTSVCFNWQQEALKFAPSLNVIVLSDAPSISQRTNLLKALKPFDCLLVSYGLLQRETEILAQVKWSTIVADEAQALKNPVAKRTKAAYTLKADFKMITTGTPIENDLSELWSLFRFVNPGLLGNLKQFHKRFIQPIANAKEDRLAAHKASLSLKALIKPFILRRLKSQVLTELPSRTEINISVQLSEQEQAFYEAIRLNALEKMAEANASANAGEQRIRLLAELVKLRQACCNPKLILAESDLPSAKLAALDELLVELRANQHRALIFSQFVGHLQLIKQHIEARGLAYQYLDGSSTSAQRKKSVNDFQAGEGEVFLISLKAGGFGLNLTGADYVIHMDPWWNPAVEDQASDRAHRMGQTRPVIIYRLVAKDTIEEKIVSLHQQKRDLADSLLAGNEQVQNLSVDDMLVLLKETL
ncbi:DEAD/DEAH box helicase [Ningiella sp. W23]|uniref:DEAD/DEAH box helicase n=1 Tax=Ningiella sp. W23 TaxID=3023715 RepID=UPI003757B996